MFTVILERYKIYKSVNIEERTLDELVRYNVCERGLHREQEIGINIVDSSLSIKLEKK